jgi:hypothetical protein
MWQIIEDDIIIVLSAYLASVIIETQKVRVYCTTEKYKEFIEKCYQEYK